MRIHDELTVELTPTPINRKTSNNPTEILENYIKTITNDQESVRNSILSWTNLKELIQNDSHVGFGTMKYHKNCIC